MFRKNFALQFRKANSLQTKGEYMPFCSKCGKENKDEAKFCQSCGNAIANTSPSKTNPKKFPIRGCGCLIFIFVIICLIILAIIGGNESEGKFTDTRDNKSYKWVKIGTQTWMAENLNYDMPDTKCYDDNPANCDKYGRLYNWETAMKACPSGWHLPSNEEWDSLYRFADGTSGTDSPYESLTAGKYLKVTSGWIDDDGKPKGNGVDKFGFSALPGGLFGLNNFFAAGVSGVWWSSSESNNDNRAYCRTMRSYRYGNYGNYTGEEAFWGYDQKTTVYNSVRCLKD